MSGSSLDGIDLALCSFDDNNNYFVQKSTTCPLPENLAKKIADFALFNAFELAELDAEFSVFTSEIIREFISDQRMPIDLIVSHGHTIYHNPEGNVSWQLGNGGIIASKCSIDTLSDLRIQDIALGGQGAPLASIIDYHILTDYDLLINLGGIANVSLRVENLRLISWDVAPCNQIFNALAEKKGLKYDDQGKLASRGNVIDELIKGWLKIDYFALNSPKSLDNTWVRKNFIDPILGLSYSIEDLLATSVEFLAIQLSNDIQKNSIKNIKGLATGGGAYNDYLIERMNARLKKLKIYVEPAAPELIEYKEAILMAYMGYLYMNNKPNTISTATGASKNIRAGALYLGNG